MYGSIVSSMFIYSVMQPSPKSNMKTFHPSRQKPPNPFIDIGEVEGPAMHFRLQGTS